MLVHNIVVIFQEAGPEGGRIHMHLEELLKSNTAIYVVTEKWYTSCEV